jgi:hypothetical protein
MAARDASHAERLSAARRRGGGKPSHPEKDRMLVEAILAEKARRANEGTLVRLGPRKYVLRPRRTDPQRELDAFR